MPVEFRTYRMLRAVQDGKVTIDHPWPRYRENGQVRAGFAPLFKAGWIRCTRIFVKKGIKGRRLVQITDQGYEQMKDYELAYMNAEKYSYEPMWSNKNKCFIAISREWPDLTHLGETPDEAVTQLMELVRETMHDRYVKGESVPKPLKS